MLSRSAGEGNAAGGTGAHRSRARLRFTSVTLRAKITSRKKTWRKGPDPLDNPHRRCSALVEPSRYAADLAEVQRFRSQDVA
jgi:hypothetical protein